MELEEASMAQANLNSYMTIINLKCIPTPTTIYISYFEQIENLFRSKHELLFQSHSLLIYVFYNLSKAIKNLRIYSKALFGNEQKKYGLGMLQGN